MAEFILNGHATVPKIVQLFDSQNLVGTVFLVVAEQLGSRVASTEIARNSRFTQ